MQQRPSSRRACYLPSMPGSDECKQPFSVCCINTRTESRTVGKEKSSQRSMASCWTLHTMWQRTRRPEPFNVRTLQERKAQMTKFKVGKTYSIKNEIGKSWFKSYEIVARTACTLTLKDESGEIIRCRISKKFSAFNNAETAFPEGVRSGNYPIRADMPYQTFSFKPVAEMISEILFKRRG